MEAGRRVQDLMNIRHIVSPDQVAGVEKLTISSDNSHEAPPVGVLTRTLVHSPVIKWAFAARIRHAYENDVVLVREHSIEIKRYLGYSRLEDVAFKADFGSSIQSAAIIGAPRAPLNALSRESVVDSKERQVDTAQAYKVPPQMLALVLQSGRNTADSLLILFAYHDGANHVRFASFRHGLFASEQVSGRLGEHIAVDPESRAVAVAAQEGRVAIHKLKPRPDIVAEVEIGNHISSENFNPILEEKLIKVDGFILQMAFLQPPIDDLSSSLLLLIVSVGTQLKRLLYQWDSLQSLQKQDFSPEKRTLSREFVNPLLLIPLKTSAGFYLVCEERLGVCGDVRSKEITQIGSLYDGKDEAADDPGNTLGFPLYTGWARPTRHAGFNARGKDAIYLCREDGLIRLIEFHVNGSNNTDSGTQPGHSNTPLGHLRVNVDSAFTVLDYDVDLYPQGSVADVLLLGGNMSDGCLFTLQARKDPRLLRSIPNWTPIRDLATTSGLEIAATSMVETPKDRVFICTGHGRRHGSISEIRYGFEAQEFARFNVEGAAYTHLWLIPDRLDGSLYVLASSADGTDVLRFADGELEFVSNPPGQHWSSFINRHFPTVYTTRTKAGMCIQITNSSINACLQAPGENTQPIFCQQNLGSLTVISGSVDGFTSSIFLTVRSETEHLLLAAQIIEKDNHLDLLKTAPFPLDDEPTCVNAQCLGNRTIALVGTRASEILLFELVETSLQCKGRYGFEEEEAICESLLVLERHQDHDSGCLILCGLRSGQLQILSLKEDDQDPKFAHIASFKLGNTAVSVVPNYPMPSGATQLSSGAMILCENSFCYFALPKSLSVSPESLQRVWFTDAKSNGIHQMSLKSAAQLEPWNQRLLTDPYASATFGLFESEVTAFHLGHIGGPRMIPWHIPIGGSPCRVTYLRHFEKLVVALATNVVIDPVLSDREFSADTTRPRLPFSVLRFVDPNDAEAGDMELKEEVFDVPPNLPPDRASFAAVVGTSGERVTGMCDWSVASSGKKWQLLLVSTVKPSTNKGRSRGRVWIYNIIPGPNRKLGLEWKYKIKADEPVSAVAGFDDRSFVYCSGASLFRQYLDVFDQTGRLGERTLAELGSTGLRISVQKPLVYVSTSAHSLRVFQASDQGFRDVFSDSISRYCCDHLVLSGYSLILVTDLEGTLTGFWQPLDHKMSGKLQTVFEASLPSKISCLREAALQPYLDLNPEIPHKPILASTVNGTFYQITILDDKTCQFLRFLQNLAERNKEICPYASPAQAHLSFDLKHSCDRHVDGDILSRITHRNSLLGHANLLQELLQASIEEIGPQVLEIFKKLAVAALGDRRGSTSDLFDDVADYLSMVLAGSSL